MLPSNLTTQHILVLGASVFEEGIAHLLAKGTGLQVSCVRYTDDFAFLSDVAQNKPDTILLNESAALNPPHILKLLFSIPALAGLRVIITRLSNNMIDVYVMPKQTLARYGYERHQYLVTKQDELLTVVRG